ncbi:MAG: AraC family transcriptional regulator [Chloroflexi bacterium]|nr:MAG: AraC family transcriptional regulator [Chloroflexota bacterium]
MDISRQPAGRPAPRTHTVATLYHVYQEARRSGLSERELEAAMGLPSESLRDFDLRVGAEQLFGAWERVMRRLRDPAFPVRAARRAVADLRSPVALLATSSRTVREALERTVEYGTAFTTVYALSLQPWPDAVAVVFDGLGAGRLGERCEAEFALADFVAVGRATLGRALRLGRVAFAHPAPPSVALHRRHFGRGVRFGAPRTELTVPAAVLSLPLRTTRPGLAAFLQSTLERTRRPAAASYSLRVRAALLERLADGEVTIEHVARRLHVSAQTLHRRLGEEGIAFRELLDETRHSVAVDLLERPDLSTAAVAERLGFASTRSFHRAFARWTGTSPRASAARATGPAAPP